MHLRTAALRRCAGWLPCSPCSCCSRPRAAPSTIRRRRSGRSRTSPRSATTSRRTTFYWALGVFMLVEGALLYAIFRFRGKPDDPEPPPDPRQHHDRDHLDRDPGADPRGHRRAHGARHLRDQRASRRATCSRSRCRAPVVVGVPLPGPQPHHRQRGPHPGRPDGVAPDEHGGRGPQLLAAAVRRQAGRVPQPARPGSGSRPSRRATIRGSAPSSAASSTAAWRSGCGPRRRRSSRPGWRTCRRWAPKPAAAGAAPADSVKTASAGATVQAAQAPSQARRRRRKDSASAAAGAAARTRPTPRARSSSWPRAASGATRSTAVDAPKGMIGPNLANVGARSYIGAGQLQEHRREPRPLDPEPAGDEEGRADAQPRRHARGGQGARRLPPRSPITGPYGNHRTRPATGARRRGPRGADRPLELAHHGRPQAHRHPLRRHRVLLLPARRPRGAAAPHPARDRRTTRSCRPRRTTSCSRCTARP